MICDKTTIWSFATEPNLLATSVALITASRHNFPAITIHTPEAPSGSFTIKSAVVVVTARDAFTIATDFDGIRIGIKLGAVAFDDVDYTYILPTTNDHELLVQQRDVTAYFQANYGAASASQTCQVGVAFATGVASAVNNLTAELFLTYQYDNAAATHCKTIEIPIQGHHQQLTTGATEVGVDSVSPAPANQIPQLTGAGSPRLPEAGITIRQLYLRIVGTEGGVASTDFNLQTKIDTGGVEVSRATLEQALASAPPYKDNWDLLAYGMSTTAAHAWIARSSLSGSFHNISAFLVCTYTFTTAGTTRELHSVRVPLENERGVLPTTNANAAGDDDTYSARLDIQEPGVITMHESGIAFYDQIAVNLTNSLFAPGQAERSHSYQALSYTGAAVLVRRCDHDSSEWTLARGKNRLRVNWRLGGTNTIAQQSGYAIVNYSADVPAQGCGVGNRTVHYDIADHQTASSGATIVTQLRVPSFPTTPWVISGSPGVLLGIRGDIRSATQNFGAERAPGEDSGSGWASTAIALSARIKVARQEIVVPTDWFKTSSHDTSQALDLTASRSWMRNGAANAEFSGIIFFTYHQCRFTVDGAVSVNGAPAPDGKVIEVFAQDADDSVERVATAVVAGGAGAFVANVPDNTRSYFASYNNDGNIGRSALGTPT